MRDDRVSFCGDDSGQLLMVGAIAISVSIILAVGLASFLPQHLMVVFSEKSHSLLSEFKMIDDEMEYALNESVGGLTNGEVDLIKENFSDIEESISRVEMQRGIYFNTSIEDIRFNGSTHVVCAINATVIVFQGDNRLKGNVMFEFSDCTSPIVVEV